MCDVRLGWPVPAAPDQKDINPLANLSGKMILPAIAVGIAATGIEIFGVWAYSKGLPVSMGSFITAGVPALTATVLGLALLGETLSFYKIFAMSLILAGTILLARA